MLQSHLKVAIKTEQKTLKTIVTKKRSKKALKNLANNRNRCKTSEEVAKTSKKVANKSQKKSHKNVTKKVSGTKKITKMSY